MRLLVGPGLFDYVGNDAFLVKALKKVADVKTFDKEAGTLEQVMCALPRQWSPDAIVIRDAEFCQMPLGLEEADVPVFALVGDYNLSLGNLLPVLGAFDYFYCDTKGVRIFNKLGFDNCEFFCLYGHDPEVHRDYGLYKDWDAMFIGNMNHSVQQDREERLYSLALLGDKYRVHIGSLVWGEEYGRFLNRSIMVFNYAIRDEVNMRFFEAMACGAVVINRHLDELDLMGFRPDVHYLAEEDPVAAMTKYFTEWTEDKKEEVQQNVKDILKHHTYDSRAQDLVERISSTQVDISRRRMLQFSEQERQLRWARYLSEEVEVNGMGMLNRFHPKVVGWQKHLVNNELEIRNFDFAMWTWWINLLARSGQDDFLRQFLSEREALLSPCGCYEQIADRVRNTLNLSLYGFHV